jgi:DNA repair ATPase RecN
MPESSLWGLIVGLILLALGLTYKNADIRQTLKRLLDELSAARSEISTLNEKQQKQIQDIEMDYQTRIDELSNTASGLRYDLNHMAKYLSDSDDKLKKVETDCATLQQQYSNASRLSKERLFLFETSQKEVVLLKKDLDRHKKYLKKYAPTGFNIDNEEA